MKGYEFSHNHPDTGPSPEGRSIGRVRDKSAPTGGWMILLICFSWPISYTYLAMVFIKVLFVLCDHIASLKKFAFLSIFLDTLDLAFYWFAVVFENDDPARFAPVSSAHGRQSRGTMLTKLLPTAPLTLPTPRVLKQTSGDRSKEGLVSSLLECWHAKSAGCG